MQYFLENTWLSPNYPLFLTMRGWLRGIFFLLVLVMAVCWGERPAKAQQEILTDLQKGDFADLQKRLPALEKKYPNNPMVAYVRAVLTTDGKAAFKAYSNFVRRYKNEKWLPPVLLRMAQFHYAQGYYISARDEFLGLARQFPNHSLAPEALYNAALCWTAMASADSAGKILRILVRKYPGSSFAKLASRELKGKEDFIVAEPKQEKGVRNFFVQTGAFSSRENALLQKQFFEQKGIKSQIRTKQVGSRTLYLVWVGAFSTAAEAGKYGQMLKKKYKVSYRVVER